MAGDPNYLRVGQPGFVPPPQGFVGGFGEVLAQIFRRNYPDYSIGFQLNIPLRNRLAQAGDYARDSLTLRQTERLRERQQMNQIRVDVQNAQIGLRQIRAQYLAARKTRELQILALDAEQKEVQPGRNHHLSRHPSPARFGQRRRRGSIRHGELHARQNSNGARHWPDSNCPQHKARRSPAWAPSAACRISPNHNLSGPLRLSVFGRGSLHDF